MLSIANMGSEQKFESLEDEDKESTSDAMPSVSLHTSPRYGLIFSFCHPPTSNDTRLQQSSGSGATTIDVVVLDGPFTVESGCRI